MPDVTVRLLEREPELLLFEEARQAAAAGRGRLMFVEGEAGIGKTSLARSFAQASRSAALWGACDPLDTPRPLGPLLDFATRLDPDFVGRITRSASSPDLFAELVGRLETLSPQPTVIVLEDIQWADQASLDMLRFLGRRIERLPALVLATMRNEDAGPVATLLGDLATAPGVQHMPLAPLSPSATDRSGGQRFGGCQRTLRAHRGQSIFRHPVPGRRWH